MNKRSAKEILVDFGLVKAADLAQVEEEAEVSRKPFHQAAVVLNLVEKMTVLNALSREWKVKPISLDAMEIAPEVVKLVSDEFARKNFLLPFMKEDNLLMVAMADPRDVASLEDLRFRTGCDIQTYLTMPNDIELQLDKTYGTSLVDEEDVVATDQQLVEAAEEKTREIMESFRDLETVESVVEKADVLQVDASAPEVERIINAVILTAIQQKASDIHIEPLEDPAGKKSRLIVRYRVDGFLKESAFKVPWSFRYAVIAKIKIMTMSMNLTERRIPQSGRIQVMAKGRPIEFRVEIIPTVFGESASLRLLDRKNVQVDLTKLGFLPDLLQRLQDQLKGVGGKKNYGMILVTGPTGSGKTTTLYGCLNYINRPDIRIITAENPVEYNIDGIVQVPVNPDLSLGTNKVFNFATALRSFLRLDPDVIMVGEIRDRETAQIATEAAMTGHLVLSTLHTNDAPGTIARLVEMGIPSYLVVNTVKCVIAQRLARAICAACKTMATPTPEEREIFRVYGFTLPEDAVFYAGKGCKSCGGSGFRGRVGMHEVLLLDEAVRRVAMTDLNTENIRAAAIIHSPQRMRTIVQDGLIKVSQGITTVPEVLGVAAADRGAS